MPRKPRYADVAATLALVLALGGTTAYAAERVAVPKHSIGKSQLKRQAVDSSRIKNGTIKQKDLRAASVGTVQLQERSVSGGKLQDNAVGGRELAPGSVGNGKLQDGSVGTNKLQDGAVTAGKLSRNAVSLDDIAGVDAVTTISVSALAPSTCTSITVPLPGAQPGQLGAMSITGSTDPQTLVLGPLRVTAGAATTSVCNVGTSAVTTALPVRVGTFG
jgi:hypothetical protein